MKHACPDCGGPIDLEERTVVVHSGDCPNCHHSFTWVPHPTTGSSALPSDAPEAPGTAGEMTEELAREEPAAGSGAAPAKDEDDDDAEDDGPAAKAEGGDDAPVCGNCGSDLVIRAADDVTIEVYCPQCEETTRFRAEGAEPKAAPNAPAPERRWEPRERSWEDRPRGPPRGRFEGPPRARGCRRCGGPIDFQPTEDGGREGVCRNCGNRFRLPPRDDDRGGRGDRRDDRRGPPRGGFRPRGPPRGGRFDSRGPPRRRRDD